MFYQYLIDFAIVAFSYLLFICILLNSNSSIYDRGNSTIFARHSIYIIAARAPVRAANNPGVYASVTRV